MRFTLLLTALLLPQLVWAQLFGGSSFESGSYVLADSHNVRHQGQLKLPSASRLVVKTADGSTLKLKPEQVYTFQIGTQKYVIAGNFHVKGGLGGTDVDKAFVQQLDSGQVMLMLYEYSIGAPAMMGAGGGMTYGGASENSAYLLQNRYAAGATAVQGGAYSSGGKNFREAVRPFLMARPELVKYLDEKRINMDNLVEAIRALNHNLPFTPPAASNLE